MLTTLNFKKYRILHPAFISFKRKKGAFICKKCSFTNNECNSLGFGLSMSLSLSQHKYLNMLWYHKYHLGLISRCAKLRYLVFRFQVSHLLPVQVVVQYHARRLYATQPSAQINIPLDGENVSLISALACRHP